MVACLFVEPYAPKGLLARMKGRLLGPVVEVRPAAAFGVGFLQLRLSRCRDLAGAWEAIEDAMPAETGCLLCPEGITPPDWLSPPAFTKLERALLPETACALIAGSGTPGSRRTAGLFDPEGDYSDMLPRLLEGFTAVKVRTRNLAHYRQVAERLLAEMGAVVLASEDASFLDCTLLLCPGEEPLPSPPCPVLSPKRIPGRMVFSEPRLANRGEVPAGIDPHRLAAALFESAGSHAIRPVTASVLLGEKRIPLERAQALFSREVQTFSRKGQ